MTFKILEEKKWLAGIIQWEKYFILCVTFNYIFLFSLKKGKRKKKRVAHVHLNYYMTKNIKVILFIFKKKTWL